MSEEITAFFVNGWVTACVPNRELVILNFSSSKRPEASEETVSGRYYALTLPQTNDLIEALKNTVQQLERAMAGEKVEGVNMAKH